MFASSGSTGGRGRGGGGGGGDAKTIISPNTSFGDITSMPTTLRFYPGLVGSHDPSGHHSTILFSKIVKGESIYVKGGVGTLFIEGWGMTCIYM